MISSLKIVLNAYGVPFMAVAEFVFGIYMNRNLGHFCSFKTYNPSPTPVLIHKSFSLQKIKKDNDAK